MLLLCTILLFPTLILGQAVSLDCLAGTQNPNKDWFVVYKLPGTADGNTISKYIANDVQTFTDSELFSNNDAPLKKTLDAYTAGAADKKAAVAYSNFPPYFASALPLSPAKGIVLMGDGDKGSWIVHSLPRFINLAAVAYTLENPAGLAVCLTMKRGDIPNIFPSLTYTGAIQYYYVGGAQAVVFNDNKIQDFVRGAVPTSTPFARSFQLKTDGDVPLSVFAKSGLARVDIYSRYMNILLRSGLKVRFNDGVRDVLPNACSFANKVENIGGTITVGGASIPAAEDDSVWAVTNGGAQSMFCISDSPRTQKHQNLGSSAVCIQEATLSGQFSTIAASSQSRGCP